MASNMILCIDPIKGESQVAPDWNEMIEILSWEWSVDNPSDLHIGTQPSCGTGNVHDITITKYNDNASMPLFIACQNGTLFKEAIIFNLRTAGEGKFEKFQFIKLGYVTIKDDSFGGALGEERVVETITLHFRAFETHYLLPDGTETTKSFNIATQAEEYPGPELSAPSVGKFS